MFGGILLTLIFIISLFLILLVLVQRGRGGGLAGAFGGMGGQSAFGTKAGDLFTRITIGTAAVWVLMCVLAVKYFNVDDSFGPSIGGSATVPTQQSDGAGRAEKIPPAAAPGGDAKPDSKADESDKP